MILRSRPNPRDNNGGHKPVEAVVLQRFGAPGDIRLSSYRGHPLVINYWASWCGYCIAEMPGFQKAYERVGSDVAFIGVDVLGKFHP